MGTSRGLNHAFFVLTCFLYLDIHEDVQTGKVTVGMASFYVGSLKAMLTLTFPV